MLDDVTDSFLLQATSNVTDSLTSGINIADLILDDSPPKQMASAPNVLSQLMEGDFPVVAGQIETADGKVLPLSIGQTDIGNGKPTPYIHISDDPSVLSRHITITTVQTNDGKFRAMLRVNHPHGKVLLGGSVVRPETLYPIMDDDEIIVGDGVRFKLRLNNQSPPNRRSIGAPTPFFFPAPNSDEMHETEEREREEKRRQFQERLTPPNDDAIFLQLAAAVDPGIAPTGIPQEGLISLVHQMGDTCPFSSGRESTSQPILPADHEEEESVEMNAQTPEDDIVDMESEPFIANEGDDDDNVLEPPVPQSEHKQKDDIEDEESVEMNDEEESLEMDSRDPVENAVIQEVSEENIVEEYQEDSHTPVQETAPVVQETLHQCTHPVPTETVLDNQSPSKSDHNSSRIDSPMSEGTEPPIPDNVNENESPGNAIESPHAPQLSQELENPELCLRDRLKLKRGISEELSQPRKRGRKQESQPEEEKSGRASTRSARNSGVTNGPKKLLILKTAIDIDKPTESAVAAVGAKLDSKWSDKVDALVTGSIVRTTKFLCAINKGLAIFPKSMLNDIKTYKALPPTDNPDLWLQDPEGERK